MKYRIIQTTGTTCQSNIGRRPMTRSIFRKIITRTLLTAALALTTCASLQFAAAQEAVEPATVTHLADYLPKYTTNNKTTLTDSQVYDNGTNVGIGTTTPVSHLHVSASDTVANGTQSAIEISNTASTNDKDWWLRVGATGTNTPDGGFSLGDDDAYWFVITFNGNFGLGLNVKNPQYLLTMADGAYENGGTWTNASDRNLKENFAPIDNATVLAKINAMPIEKWNYKSEGKNVLHLGPVAQDFYAAFGLGQDDKHISTVDEGGVALAAIQELYRQLQQKDAQIHQLSAQVEQLQQLQQTVQVLSTRLSKIENADANVSVLRASR